MNFSEDPDLRDMAQSAPMRPMAMMPGQPEQGGGIMEALAELFGQRMAVKPKIEMTPEMEQKIAMLRSRMAR